MAQKRFAKLTLDELYDTSNTQQVYLAKMGVEIPYDQTTQSQQVYLAKMGVEIPYDTSLTQTVNFCKLGAEVLYDYTQQQYVQFCKLGAEVLYDYTQQQYVQFCKLGAEVLYNYEVTQSAYLCKIGVEVLTIDSDYTVNPLNNYYDPNQPYIKSVFVSIPDLTADITDDYVAIKLDENNAYDFFDTIVSNDWTDDFSNLTLDTYAGKDEADASSLYVDPAQCLVIQQYENKYAHIEINPPKQNNFEIYAKVKVGSLSGATQCPGIGIWQDSSNCIFYGNRYATSNQHVSYTLGGVTTEITGAVASGSTSYIDYRIIANYSQFIFQYSTDGQATWTDFTRLDRHDGIDKLPTKLMVGKGCYNPAGGYPNLHWNNNHATPGSRGYSYIKDYFAVSYSGGKDIVITLDDKVTSVPCEIGYWIPRSKRGMIIFKAPLIYRDRINRFHIYYNNPVYEKTAVYDVYSVQRMNNLGLQRFVSLRGNSAPVMKDYVSANNGTISGTNNQTKLTTDIVADKAYIFDGSTNYATIPHNTSLNVPAYSTRFFEFTMKAAPGTGGYVLSKKGFGSMGQEVDITAWLTGWSARRSVTVSRASGAVTNYPLMVTVGQSAGAGATVHCTGLSNLNFSDLRFTTADKTTLLPYWIEEITGSSPNLMARVQIKFDSIGTGATTFYMYYGKSDATAYSDGSSTFQFFDDFTTFNTDVQTADTAGGSVVTSGSVVSIDNTNASSSAGIYSKNRLMGNANKNFIIEVKYRTPYQSGAPYRNRLYNTNTANGGSVIGDCGHFDGNVFWNGAGTGVSLSANTWYIQQWLDSSTNYNMNVLNTSYGTVRANTYGSSVANTGYLTLRGTENVNSDMSIEFVRARKYEITEPAWGSWSNQLTLTDCSDLGGYQIKVDNTGRISMYVFHDTTAAFNHESYCDTSILDNSFHTIEILVDRSKPGAYIQVDGSNYAVTYTGSTLVSKSFLGLNPVGNLIIGADQTNMNKFNGVIGHLRYSSATRKSGQIVPTNQEKQTVVEQQDSVNFFDLFVPIIINSEIGISDDGLSKYNPRDTRIVYLA